jgi:hypothetical protein
MHIAKLRVPADENGLVPAGEYFKRLSLALREANEREAQKRLDSKMSAYTKRSYVSEPQAFR